jgi:pentatricopeptide repeat protein
MLEAGKLQCASEIYERMHTSGVPCSIQTYNTMISVYGRGLQLDKAIEIFSNARRSGLYLDEKIYTNMIMHYGKGGMYLIKKFINMLRVCYQSQFLADMECSVTLTCLDSGYINK